MRIFIVGDELVTGFGDTRALGWVGRVVARTSAPAITVPLAFPGEGTEKLGARWEREVTPRLDPDGPNRLVVALGSHDLGRTTTARSRLHLANMLDNAIRLDVSPFVVGPPPRLDVPMDSQELLNHAFSEVCQRRAITYVDTFTPLREHQQWLTDMATSLDGYCPRQAGYGLIAWLVLHKGWHNWLGITPAAGELDA